MGPSSKHLRQGITFPKKSAFIFLIICFFPFRAIPSQDQEVKQNPYELLQRMQISIANLNYKGTFVHLHGNQLESMQIIHRVEDGIEQEHLLSLNGSAREVLRDQEMLVCILPDLHEVTIDERWTGGQLARIAPKSLEDMKGLYQIEYHGETRIAGRSAEIVSILSSDDFRYSQLLFLDQQSGLPLKVVVLDTKENPLVQLLFTNIEIGDSIPENALPEPIKHYKSQPRRRTDVEIVQDRQWQFQELPPGFRLVVHDRWVNPQGLITEHLVLSDGLAAVSVYLEAQNNKAALQGVSSLGAVNAWGGSVADWHVVVVGEVPQNTVQMIGHNLLPRPSAQSTTTQKTAETISSTITNS